jgi:hypothetical protein
MTKYIVPMKWIMSGLFTLGAILLSSNVSFGKYGFFAFLLAHSMAIYVFSVTKDSPLFWHNLSFLLIDFWGIYRWFIL